MSYELAYTESARETLAQLDTDEVLRLQKALAILREDPYHAKSQPVHEEDETVREVSPTANSLAIYKIIDGRWAVILVLRVNHDSLI